MASAIDVCNLALAHLGDSATVSSISPSDGSAQADHCARFYPIARDALLELHAWNFATKREALSETTDTPPAPWAYCYSMPTGVIRSLAILPPGATDDTKSDDYIIEANSNGDKVIYTNTETATLRFTAAITDTTKFSHLFVNALSYLLASYLAGPITRDPGVKKSMYQMFQVEMAKAGLANATSQQNIPVITPTWIEARGGVTALMADGRIVR